MPTNRGRLLPVCGAFLVAACSAVSNPVAASTSTHGLPVIVGTFSGTSSFDLDGKPEEIGSGSLVLGADRTFLLRFEFVDAGMVWDCAGDWEIVAQEPGDGSVSGFAKLLLDVRTSRGSSPPLGKTSLYVMVTDESASVAGGPCLGFDLPRVR